MEIYGFKPYPFDLVAVIDPIVIWGEGRRDVQIEICFHRDDQRNAIDTTEITRHYLGDFVIPRTRKVVLKAFARNHSRIQIPRPAHFVLSLLIKGYSQRHVWIIHVVESCCRSRHIDGQGTIDQQHLTTVRHTKRYVGRIRPRQNGTGVVLGQVVEPVEGQWILTAVIYRTQPCRIARTNTDGILLIHHRLVGLQVHILLKNHRVPTFVEHDVGEGSIAIYLDPSRRYKGTIVQPEAVVTPFVSDVRRDQFHAIARTVDGIRRCVQRKRPVEGILVAQVIFKAVYRVVVTVRVHVILYDHQRLVRFSHVIVVYPKL